MAIFHCSLRVFSRADGASAVAAAAYRAGQKLMDDRLGFAHHYQHRKGVAASFIMAPPYAPETTYNRALLWNAAEAAENRKNARVARELILALPHELSAASRESVVRGQVLWMVERYGVAVDAAIHIPVEGDGHDRRNHHAHLLFTTREVTKDGFAKKTRILDDKLQGPQEVELIRSVWETLVNDALEREGFPEAKIDRRTLEDQGIDRVPQIHVGPESKAMEERQQEDEDEEGDKDGDDKGDGKKGKGGNGDSKAPNLNPSKAGDDGKGHKVDYPAIDQDRRRGDMAREIKTLNAERAQWPNTPLGKQIRTLEHEMSRLDTRLRHYQVMEAKTSLSGVVRHAITKAVKVSREILRGRMERRSALRLSEREYRLRISRQKERYGRNYRAGVHDQIKTMRTKLDILKGTHTDYQKYRMFVVSIEKALAARPVQLAATTSGPPKLITDKEFSLKLTLKAALMRENMPKQFRPPTPPPRAEKPLPAPIKAVVEKSTARLSAQAGARPALAPAKARGIKEPVRALFNQAAAPLPKPQPQEPKPVKIVTYEEVRTKAAITVAQIRKAIPPKFQAPPYPPQTPKVSKMSSKFNKAAAGMPKNPSYGIPNSPPSLNS